MDSHEDTTTTDYDSGDSGRVSYAYEGGKATASSKQLTKAIAASPARRKPNKSRSPQAKTRTTVLCCHVCGAVQSPPPSDSGDNASANRNNDYYHSDDAESTEFEEDTDVENGGSCGGGAVGEGDVEHRCRRQTRRRRRRLSGPEGGNGSNRSSKKVSASSLSSSAKRAAGSRKRTPYIEEYPEDPAWRPTILLKEHKLPRRFSTSDAKGTGASQNSVEDRERGRGREHDPSGTTPSGSRGRSPPGKRLPAWAAQQGVQQGTNKKNSTTNPRRRHSDFQAVPGGKYLIFSKTLLDGRLTSIHRHILRLRLG